MTLVDKKILLVDDEEKLLNSMAKRISLLGFTPLKAVSGLQAIEMAKATPVDIAIVDLKMPDMDGLVTITKLKEILPNLKTILLTGYGNEKIRQATEAMGSMYVEKDAMGRLWDLIKQSPADGRVIVINPPDGERLPPAETAPASQADFFHQASKKLPFIIGETPKMQRLKKNIQRLAEMDCTIIIQGETGTGKELAARTIHRLSHRKDQRFLAFDCGCFSSDFHFNELIASFAPSAINQKTHTLYFSGTILLDHIENMPRHTQQEMLSILDQKKHPAGADSSGTFFDVRFIVASHKSLEEQVKKSRFSRDLYQRIRAIELEMPSLKERKEDIPPLCISFLNQFNAAFNKKITAIADEVYRVFDAYPFPGNIRELQHIIERAVILAQKETIEIKHLPERLQQKNAKPAAILAEEFNSGHRFPSLSEMEHAHILKALEITQGNKSKASELLGISRAALWRKLRILAADS